MSSLGQEVLTLHTPVANGANASFGRTKRSSATSNRYVRNERSQSCTAFERTYLKLQENVSETLRERI